MFSFDGICPSYLEASLAECIQFAHLNVPGHEDHLYIFPYPADFIFGFQDDNSLSGLSWQLTCFSTQSQKIHHHWDLWMQNSSCDRVRRYSLGGICFLPVQINIMGLVFTHLLWANIHSFSNVNVVWSQK